MLWNKLGATLANSSNASKALDAYRNALEINPSFIRARYNSAVACIQLGSYREAVGHLLSALSIQEDNINMVLSQHKGKEIGDFPLLKMQGLFSNSIWSTLRMVVEGYRTLLINIHTFIYLY